MNPFGRSPTRPGNRGVVKVPYNGRIKRKRTSHDVINQSRLRTHSRASFGLSEGCPKELKPGALYEVTICHLSLRNKDRAKCFVCRQVMVEWDTTSVPYFRLIR